MDRVTLVPSAASEPLAVPDEDEADPSSGSGVPSAASERLAVPLSEDPYRQSSLSPPLLRGWSHLFCIPPACAAWIYLLLRSPESPARTLLGLYGWTLVQMFVASALFHRRRWSDAGWLAMRKVDHLGIFFLIGGSNAAIVGLGASGAAKVWIPAVALSLIGVGMIMRLLTTHPPFGLMNSVFLTVGGVGLFALPSLTRNLGAAAAVLLVVGVVLYGAGALCLGARFPFPRAKVFGYHEIWHLNVIGGAACHYFVVLYWIIPRL